MTACSEPHLEIDPDPPGTPRAPGNVQGVGPTVALVVVLLGAVAVTMGAVFAIPAFQQAFGLSASGAGAMTSLELAAMVVASLAAARFVERRDLRVMLAAGVLLALAANIASLLMPDLFSLCVMRILAGAGNGMVVFIAMTLAGRSRHAQRFFAVITAGIAALGVALGFVLPPLIDAAGYVGVMGAYVALGLAGLAAIPRLGRLGPIAGDVGGGEDWLRARQGWLALCGVGFLMLGHTVTNVALVRVAEGVGLDLTRAGQIVAAGSIASVVIPLLAALGGRTASRRAILVVVALTALGAVVVTLSEGRTAFVAAAVAYAAAPSLFLPLVLGRFSELDPTGRLAGAHPPFAMTGAALAPTVAGFAGDAGGSAAIGWVSVAGLVGGATLLYGVLGRPRAES